MLPAARPPLGGRAGRDDDRPDQIAAASTTPERRLGPVADARERRLCDGRGTLRPRAIPERPDGRPGVAARAAVPPGDAGGGRDLARGAAGLPLPADDEERLPAPPRLVDLGSGDELGGPGVVAGRAGRSRPGPARGRATAAPGPLAAGRAEDRFRATDQAAPGTLMSRLP